MMLATDTMNTAQAAKRLGCSPRTIHRRVRENELTPLMKVPGLTGAFIFATAEVERYAAEQRKGAGQEEAAS